MRNILSLVALATLSGCLIENEPRRLPDDEPSTPVVRPTVPPGPSTPLFCGEDALEPNDVTPTSGPADFFDLTLTTDDVDLFEVVLAPDDTLWADAFFTNADGNLDLYVTFDGEILASSISDDNDESITYVNDTGSVLTVLVEANLWEPLADTCVYYDLELTVLPPEVTPPPTCTDDVSEPNQTYDSATELLAGIDTVSVFDFVAGDADWAYLTLVPGEEVAVVVEHYAPGTQLDVTIWDELGELVLERVSANTETIAIIDGGDFGQVVDILVEPVAANTCAPYSITIDSILQVCLEDALEPNDVDAVYANAPAALTLFDTDVDRIAIDVLPGEELWVDATFDNAFGNIDLELFDLNGVSLDGSATNSNLETLSFFNNGPYVEELTVEVTLFNAPQGTCQDVVLDWVIYPPSCIDDAYEGNDTPSGAYALLPQTGVSTTYDLIADDDDWFTLETFPGEVVDVFIEHGTSGAVLDLTAYDALGQVGYDAADLPWVEGAIALPATPLGDLYELEVRPLSAHTCLPYTITVISY